MYLASEHFRSRMTIRSVAVCFGSTAVSWLPHDVESDQMAAVRVTWKHLAASPFSKVVNSHLDPSGPCSKHQLWRWLLWVEVRRSSTLIILFKMAQRSLEAVDRYQEAWWAVAAVAVEACGRCLVGYAMDFWLTLKKFWPTTQGRRAVLASS